MRKTTLAALAAAMIVAQGAAAQSQGQARGAAKAAQKLVKQLLERDTKLGQIKDGRVGRTPEMRKFLAVAKAAEGKVAKPKVQTEYTYNGTDWLESGTYTFYYDERGNESKISYVGSDGYIEVTYTYDSEGRMTEMLGKTSQDGVNYTNWQRQQITYDGVAKDTPVKDETATWDGSKWVAEANVSYSYAVERDAQQRVTSTEGSNVQGVNGEYLPVFRQSYTYGQDGKAESAVYGEYDGEWADVMGLNNMQWLKTDNQLIYNFEQWTGGENVLGSANITMTYMGTTLDVGALQFTDDGKGGWVQDIDMSTVGLSTKRSHTLTDANGSYDEDLVMNMDGDYDGVINDSEVILQQKQVFKYDEKGSLTLNEVYYGDAQNPYGLLDGYKAEYTYDAENGGVAEYVESYLDGGDYVPTAKYVTDEFVFVTSGISDAKSDATAYKSGVYNLQGVKVAENLDGKLPQGIYIYKGKKVFKGEKVKG